MTALPSHRGATAWSPRPTSAPRSSRNGNARHWPCGSGPGRSRSRRTRRSGECTRRVRCRPRQCRMNRESDSMRRPGTRCSCDRGPDRQDRQNQICQDGTPQTGGVRKDRREDREYCCARGGHDRAMAAIAPEAGQDRADVGDRDDHVRPDHEVKHEYRGQRQNHRRGVQIPSNFFVDHYPILEWLSADVSAECCGRVTAPQQCRIQSASSASATSRTPLLLYRPETWVARVRGRQ